MNQNSILKILAYQIPSAEGLNDHMLALLRWLAAMASFDLEKEMADALARIQTKRPCALLVETIGFLNWWDR